MYSRGRISDAPRVASRTRGCAEEEEAWGMGDIGLERDGRRGADH
jgi:hypothetical protein